LDPYFLESLDPYPHSQFPGSGSAIWSGSNVPFYFFHVKNTNFLNKIKPCLRDLDLQIFQTQDPDPQIFQTLDPDPNEMDEDPKRKPDLTSKGKDMNPKKS